MIRNLFGVNDVHRYLLPGFSALIVTLGGLALPVAASAAPPSTSVTCGQTLTSSTRLANDLLGCPGDGLVIGADNITIDLGGHAVSGMNAAGSEGVADDGHRGATIRNGTIEGFFLNGVALRSAPRSAVHHVTIRRIGAGGGDTDSSAGVLVKDSPYSSVTASKVTNDVVAYQSDGVDVLSSAGTTVTGNRLANNAWNGMVVVTSPRTHVVGNAFDGNQNQGIEVNGGSDGTVLARNHAADNVSSGLVVGDVSHALIEGNTLSGNGDSGLFMFDIHSSRVIGNRAHGNGVGINLDGGQNGSSGIYVADNDTSRNSGTGIVVADNANHNTIVGNVSNANQGLPGEGGGIILFGVTGNTVRSNVANRNLDVGIGVFEDQPGDSTGNRLRGNVANANQAHGIDVVDGTIDNGGNRAHGNTPLPNCLGVTCT